MKLPQMVRCLRTICRSHRLVNETKTRGCEIAEQVKAAALASTEANIATLVESIRVAVNLSSGSTGITLIKPGTPDGWQVCRGGHVVEAYLASEYASDGRGVDRARLAAGAAAAIKAADLAIAAS